MLAITTKPGKKYASLKRPDIYEALRRQGMSKQRAARISNAQANKDTGTEAGTPLHGPGGLLGTPGMGSRRKPKRKADDYPDQTQFAGYTMEDWDDTKPDSFFHDTRRRGRKWGNRRKDKACTCGVNVATKEQLSPGVTRIRGNLCNVHGRYGPCDAGAAAKKPKGKKGRAAKPKKPVKTPEQRLAERQQAQSENRSKVFSQLGLPEDAVGALEDLRSGKAVDDDGGLVKMGLAEQAADGSYRLTPAGRALANAAASGDVGRARDTISGARDRTAARQERQSASALRKQAAEQRKQEVAARRAAAQEARKKRQEEAAKKRGSSGGKQQTGGRGGDKQQEQVDNRASVRKQMADSDQGLAPGGFDALVALGEGTEPPDPQGLIDQGVAERGSDGHIRLTAAGRAAINASNRGDAKGAIDAISRGRDQLTARQERRTATEQRRSQREIDRFQREQERQRRLAERQQSAQRATAPAERVSGTRPGIAGPSRKRGRMQRSNVGTRTKDYPMVVLKAGDPGDYLVVEDRNAPSTWHLQVKKNGKVDHRLLGAAWAALHGGYRGNKYQGPNKQEAIGKLRKLYEQEGMPVPSEKSATKSLRIVPTGGDTIQGNATAPEAYLHARTYGEISQSWLQQLLDQGYAYQVSDNGYALYEQSELVAKHPGLQAKLDHIRESNRPDLKSFTVFKSSDGSYRWIARTTTAYRDRDGEIITTKALETDAARMTATGQFGPLRYWHLGQPDPFDPAQPWGKGVDIGDCDYSTVLGRTSIESGTFKSADIGKAFAQAADDYELSPGFFHPVDQPTQAGEYEEIRRFERSVVPIKYGRASNLFTGMTVKERKMDQQEYERRMKAFAADMQSKGVPPEVAGAVVAGMEQADKSAQAQGVAYKTDDPWAAVTAALKAAMAPASMEQAADTEMDDAMEEQFDEDGLPPVSDGEYIGDMSPVAFKAMMGEVLAPVLKMQDMLKAMSDMHGELKGMMGGTATKSAANTTEIATLKAQIADATKRLATLEGDQPAVVSSADVEAALKGAPQAPPDPNAPIVPDDPNRPFAAVAARTFPNLYRQNPDGTFAGWQVPPSNS